MPPFRYLVLSRRALGATVWALQVIGPPAPGGRESGPPQENKVYQRRTNMRNSANEIEER